MRRERTAVVTPKSTAKRKKKKEDIYAYDADAVPVLLTFALRWGCVSIHANREKKENPGGENTMRCSALLFVRRKGNVWLRKAGYVCNVGSILRRWVMITNLGCLAMCHPCIVRLTKN
jgi:hypothetical protein